MAIDFNNTMKNKTAYLTMQEINKMLKYCYDNKQYKYYMLILTLARTGRRITEIVGERPYTRKQGLKPRDIHEDLIEFDILKKNHIKIRSSKTGNKLDKDKVNRLRLQKMPKRALFPVDSEFLNVIKNYIEINNISANSRIFPFTRQWADCIIKKVAKACNINRPNYKIHAHMFRHALAVNLLKDNPNDASVLKQLQQLLDHSNINVTYHYAQFTQEDKKEKLEKLFNKNGDE